MGSHYYEPNLNVEQQLQHYKERVVKYKQESEAPNLELPLQIHFRNTYKTAEACVSYLTECHQKGIKYVSVADLPLHTG